MSRTFWLAEQSFSRDVRITMVRSEQALGEEANGSQTEKMSGVIERAMWVQKGQAHYLMYDGEWLEPNDSVGPSGNATDASEPRSAHTVWKVESGQVTLIQRGFAVWTLKFHPEHATTTTGYLGQQPVAVEVHTTRLYTDIVADGGTIQIAWEAVVGGISQSVSLCMTFSP